MFKNKKEVIDYIESQKRFTKKEDLSHINALLSYFDNPHKDFKVIHVAGTNGKGSVSMYITNILMALGFNCCTYVSPYVTEFNERIQYNLNYIDDTSLINISNRIVSEVTKHNDTISFFEFCTVLGFIYFKSLNPDFVIAECGMGGVIDDTNSLTALTSVITNVNLDHQKQLGNTIYEICENKLGILKQNGTLVFKNNPLLNDLAYKRCKSTNSKLILMDEKNISNLKITSDYTIFDYKDLKNIKLKLLGAYQAENASLAVEAIYSIKSYLNKSINEINDAIKIGLEKTFWPGRLEKISEKPLVFLDGAHNIDGVSRLREFILEYDINKVTIICAISSDKLTYEMVNILSSCCVGIFFTEFDYKRSDDKNHLYDLCSKENKAILNNSKEVYDYVFNTHHNEDEVIFITGSLYFVSEFRKLIPLN